MKKLSLCVFLAIALMIGQVYAIDFSVGVTTPGFGMGILRGEAATEAVKSYESPDFLDAKKDFGLSMFPMVQVDFIVEFLPFLALETGVGYGTSTVSYTNDDSKTTVGFKRDGIIIPLMARGQYDLGMVSIYGSIGPKFVIPISEYQYVEIDGKDETENTIGQGRADDYFNKFIMDLGFAIGAEYKIADVHHVGLRVGYDLNLISPIKDDGKSQFSAEKANDWYHDVFAVSLTYRYAFKK